MRIFDVAPFAVLDNFVGEEDLLLPDRVRSGTLRVLLDQELLALDPAHFLGVQRENLEACSLNYFAIIRPVLDFGRSDDDERVEAFFILEDEIARGGRRVDGVVFWRLEGVNVEDNKLIVIIIRLFLIHEHKEVQLVVLIRQVTWNYRIDVPVEALVAFGDVALVFLVRFGDLWELEVFDVLEVNIIDCMVAF